MNPFYLLQDKSMWKFSTRSPFRKRHLRIYYYYYYYCYYYYYYYYYYYHYHDDDDDDDDDYYYYYYYCIDRRIYFKLYK